MPSEETRLLLRVEAAARLLDVSKSHLHNLIARGEIRVVRLGRSVRIPLEELHRLVRR